MCQRRLWLVTLCRQQSIPEMKFLHLEFLQCLDLFLIGLKARFCLSSAVGSQYYVIGESLAHIKANNASDKPESKKSIICKQCLIFTAVRGCVAGVCNTFNACILLSYRCFVEVNETFSF